jgi:hypothetical protein
MASSKKVKLIPEAVSMTVTLTSDIWELSSFRPSISSPSSFFFFF